MQTKKCKNCEELITGPKAQRKQTRYCDRCARTMKKTNSLDPWTTDKRREYNKTYMRGYRRDHPGLSTPYVRKFRANQRKAASSEAGAVAMQCQSSPEERS